MSSVPSFNSLAGPLLPPITSDFSGQVLLDIHSRLHLDGICHLTASVTLTALGIVPGLDVFVRGYDKAFFQLSALVSRAYFAV